MLICLFIKFVNKIPSKIGRNNAVREILKIYLSSIRTPETNCQAIKKTMLKPTAQQ